MNWIAPLICPMVPRMILFLAHAGLTFPMNWTTLPFASMPSVVSHCVAIFVRTTFCAGQLTLITLVISRVDGAMIRPLPAGIAMVLALTCVISGYGATGPGRNQPLIAACANA